LQLDKGLLCVDFWYPSYEIDLPAVRLTLTSVRSADDIRIAYDMKRDGWKIERFDSDDRTTEVAFIPARADTPGLISELF
jgi:hypothetical protein